MMLLPTQHYSDAQSHNHPNNAFAYNNLGNALGDQGNLVEAITNYRTALRVNPNRTPAENNLQTTIQNNLRIVEQHLAEQQRR